MGKELVAKGSITDLSKSADTALTLLDAKLVLICDRSSSMCAADAMNGKTRAEIEDQIVSDLQEKYPGQIVLEAFANSAILCLNGVLPYPDGRATNMAPAFQLASTLVGVGMRAILLTDGESTDTEAEMLSAAQPLKGKLDIVFIGPDLAAGRKSMEKLAKAVNGDFNHNDLKSDPRFLGQTIERLMLKAGK